jgi:hypothetical protein
MGNNTDKNGNPYPRFKESTNIVHGTRQGYDYHRRVLHEDACMACSKAHSDHWKLQRIIRKEQINANSRARRQKSPQTATGHWYKKRLDELLEAYGPNCYLCGSKIDFKAPRKVGQPGWEYSFHPDHLIPLSKGGEDTLENVRPSHAKCNMQKWATIMSKTTNSAV